MFGRKKAELVADLEVAQSRINYLDGIIKDKDHSLEAIQRSYDKRIQNLIGVNERLLADKNGLLKRMQGASAIMNGREWKPEEAVTELCRANKGVTSSFSAHVGEIRTVYQKLFSVAYSVGNGADLLVRTGKGLCGYVPEHLRTTQRKLFLRAGLNPTYPFGRDGFELGRGIKPSLIHNRGRLLWVSYIASGGEARNFKHFCRITGYEALDFKGQEILRQTACEC